MCLLAGDEANWMEQFLRPVLENAGYKVVTKIKPGEAVAIALAMDSDDLVAVGNAPIVRLRADPKPPSNTDDSVYRYDRDGLLAALAKRHAGGRG